MAEKEVKGLVGLAGLGSWWLSSFTEQERDYIGRRFDESESNKTYVPGIRVDFSGDHVSVGDQTGGPYTPVRAGDTGAVQSLTKDINKIWRSTDGNPRALLSNLFGLVRKSDPHLSQRLIAKLIELDAVVELHSCYGHEIGNRKGFFDDPDQLRNAIAACERQIALAPRVAKLMRGEWKAKQKKVAESKLSTTLRAQIRYSDFTLPYHHGYSILVEIRQKQGNRDEAIRLCHEALKMGWQGNWNRIIGECQQMRLF